MPRKIRGKNDNRIAFNELVGRSNPTFLDKKIGERAKLVTCNKTITKTVNKEQVTWICQGRNYKGLICPNCKQVL